ncbi:MAG: TetR family transcriptional regulator [Alphaproteobacteria bacterium]|nr:TetR family transcriptional regulator [Alphaproteobacteria bacterium]
MKRREQILRRAAEVFAERGVAQTSLEEIATSVGIKREAIYYYFRNRVEILLEIISPQSLSLLHGITALMGGTGSSREKLRSAMELHLQAFTPSYIEMTVALREEHVQIDDPRVKELRRVWEEYGNCWETLIRQGREEGVFRSDMDPKIASYGILGMLNWMSRWYRTGQSAPIGHVAETFFTLVTEGLDVRK